MMGYIFLISFFLFAEAEVQPLLSAEGIEKVKVQLKEKKILPAKAVDFVFDFYAQNRFSVGGLKETSCLYQKGYKIRAQDPKQKKEDLHKGILNESCVCVVDYTQGKTERRGVCIFLKNSGVDSIETFPVAHGSGSEEKEGRPVSFTNKLTPTGTTLSGLHLTGVKTTVFGGKEKTVGPYTSTGLSLYGLESSNWTASAVGKVTHGAPYVVDQPLSVGHSLGCPAMPMATAKKLLPLCQGQALWYNYTLDDVNKNLLRSCKSF